MMSSELENDVWWVPSGNRPMDLRLEEEALLPSESYEGDKEDRAKRFKSIITSREKEILRKIQRHKKRLKDTEAERKGRLVRADATREDPNRIVSENWFMFLQCFAWFCTGRAYRRDGMIPEFEPLEECFAKRKLSTELESSRVLTVEIGGLKTEIWFDGRICCTADAERRNEVLRALQAVSAAYDEALGTT